MRSVSEQQVQAVWYDAKLRPRRLATELGSEVTVISPGEWNQGAGPDFKNAVLEVGKARSRLVGDVEIHLCPADWDFHGHGADPNYRNVIAHVTWKRGRAPKSLPSGTISIWLGQFVRKTDVATLRDLDLKAYPYARLPATRRPCERYLKADPERLEKVLSAAGRHRLRMKARRMLGRLCASPANERQIFYEEVMTALGYKNNPAQFRHVAELVPVDSLPKEMESARTALLAAGSFENFDRRCCRPHNSPESRLAAAASLFVTTDAMGLSKACDFSQKACRAMVRTLCGDHCMGRGRAGAVIANVVAPFAIATGRLAELPDWLPPEDVSMPVRLTASRLLGGDHDSSVYAGNGLFIQGLIQIHRDYCLRNHPDCEECGLNEDR